DRSARVTSTETTGGDHYRRSIDRIRRDHLHLLDRHATRGIGHGGEIRSFAQHVHAGITDAEIITRTIAPRDRARWIAADQIDRSSTITVAWARHRTIDGRDRFR